MRKNKRLFAVVIALAVWAGVAVAAASDGAAGVWVERNDGGKVGYRFADKPVITYVGDKLVMTTSAAKAEYPISGVKRVYFDEVATAIERVGTGEAPGAQLITMTGDGARLSGFRAGTPVSIYDIGGRLVATEKTDAEGRLTVSLAGRPQGIYVIKAEQSTLKIHKQ